MQVDKARNGEELARVDDLRASRAAFDSCARTHRTNTAVFNEQCAVAKRRMPRAIDEQLGKQNRARWVHLASTGTSRPSAKLCASMRSAMSLKSLPSAFSPSTQRP